LIHYSLRKYLNLFHRKTSLLLLKFLIFKLFLSILIWKENIYSFYLYFITVVIIELIYFSFSLFVLKTILNYIKNENRGSSLWFT